MAQGIGAVVLWILYQAALTRERRKWNLPVLYRGMWQQRSALLRFSVPATVSGVTGSLVIWWCNADLARLSGYGELAVYTAASNLRQMVLFVPVLVARVASPVLNNLRAAGDHSSYRRCFWGMVGLNGGIALVLATSLGLFGQETMRLFGRDFAGSPLLITLLLASAVVEVVACNLYQTIFAGGSLWWQAGINTVWIAVLAGCCWWTVPRMGAAGLAVSYLAAWSVSAVLYGAMTTVARHPKLEAA
jgi:O-antigen/teichoic acid export membrane protein